jgi:RNA polymerase subunit RPABC4/transcription elongation factor Spt4
VLQVCTHCTTKCAADLPRCPHCGGTELTEEGAEMAKITAHGGPSHAHDIPAAEVRESPGTGVAMEPVEMTANEDGTFTGEITGDGTGVALPPADEAPESPSTDESEAEGDDTNNDVEPDAQPAAATTPRPATNATKKKAAAKTAARRKA